MNKAINGASQPGRPKNPTITNKTVGMKKPIIEKQRISKKQLVKNWLLAGRTLTHRQCSMKFGADRLADIVYKLRGEGMKISGPLKKGQDRYLNDVHYSVYKWMGEKPRIRFNHIGNKVTVYDLYHHYPMTTAVKKKNVKTFMEKITKTIKKIWYEKKGNRVFVDAAGGKYIFWIYFKP